MVADHIELTWFRIRLSNRKKAFEYDHQEKKGPRKISGSDWILMLNLGYVCYLMMARHLYIILMLVP